MAQHFDLGALRRVVVDYVSGEVMLQSFITQPPPTLRPSPKAQEEPLPKPVPGASGLGDSGVAAAAETGDGTRENEAAAVVEEEEQDSEISDGPLLLALVLAGKREDVPDAVRATGQLERVGLGLLSLQAEEDRAG